MKSIVGLTGAALLMGTGAAMAADCTGGGNVAVTPGLLGEAYTAFIGLEVPGTATGTCSFGFPLISNARPGTISVYSVDYRGYVYIENKDEPATISFTHNGVTETENFTGESDDDYTHSGIIASKDGRLVDSTTVNMTGTSDDENDIGTVDSADYAEIGRITLPTDESTIVAHLGASASLLTSGQPISQDNSFTLFGGIGSAMLGGTGQYQLGQGFSLLGGAAYVLQDYATSHVGGAIGAVALRYVEPGAGGFRPYAEGGVLLGGLGLTFTDPAKTTTTAGLGSLYVKGGAVADLDGQNSVTLSGSLEETLLGVNGYSLSNGLFGATIPTQSGRFTVVKATAEWHGQLTETLDASASGSVGVLMAHDEVSATISGLGTVTQAPPTQLFVDYGARLGWQFAPGSRLEGFAQGSTTQDLGTHLQIGAAYTQKF